MSIMCLSNEIIGNLAYSIGSISQMWVNGSYLETTSEGRIYTEGLEKLLVTCFQANEECYCTRYKENLALVGIKVKTATRAYSKCQCLKLLQFLRYNIEEEYLQNNIDKQLKLLDNLIDGLKSNIIAEIPEYVKAVWSNPSEQGENL